MKALQTLKTNLKMEFTGSSNDVLARLFNHALDHGIRLGQTHGSLPRWQIQPGWIIKLVLVCMLVISIAINTLIKLNTQSHIRAIVSFKNKFIAALVSSWFNVLKYEKCLPVIHFPKSWHQWASFNWGALKN